MLSKIFKVLLAQNVTVKISKKFSIQFLFCWLKSLFYTNVCILFCSAAEEILTEAMIIILNYHCNKSKTYHKEFKTSLRSAISKYSHNMQFLFSMVWNEVRL